MRVASATVTFRAKFFMVLFELLVNSPYDVVRGINFLEECMTRVECAASEVLLFFFLARGPRAANMLSHSLMTFIPVLCIFQLSTDNGGITAVNNYVTVH